MRVPYGPQGKGQSTHNMPKRDLDQALTLQAALMQALVAHPGGRDDAGAMSHVRNLCAAAVEAVNDLDARVKIRGIESLARLLFSADGHEGIEAGPPRRGGAPRVP